jgi:hypothetical protein
MLFIITLLLFNSGDICTRNKRHKDHISFKYENIYCHCGRIFVGTELQNGKLIVYCAKHKPNKLGKTL